MKRILIIAAALCSGSVFAANQELLVKIAPETQKSTMSTLQSRLPAGSKIEDLGIGGWTLVKMPMGSDSSAMILRAPGVCASRRTRN